MERTFIQRLIVIGFIFIFPVAFLSSADEMIPPDILNAAQEGINIFLKDRRVTDLEPFGFSSRKDVDDAVLGDWFQVFTVHPDNLLRDDASRDLHSMAVPTNLWKFLIMTGGKATILLTVNLVNDKWTPSSIGAAGLAKELSEILKKWPGSAGYKYRFITIFQAKSHLVEVSLGEKIIGIIPLISARMAMGLDKRDFDPMDLYNSEDVITRIRPVVRKNIEMGN
jgi:hypothetical protein